MFRSMLVLEPFAELNAQFFHETSLRFSVLCVEKAFSQCGIFFVWKNRRSDVYLSECWFLVESSREKWAQSAAHFKSPTRKREVMFRAKLMRGCSWKRMKRKSSRFKPSELEDQERCAVKSNQWIFISWLFKFTLKWAEINHWKQTAAVCVLNWHNKKNICECLQSWS